MIGAVLYDRVVTRLTLPSGSLGYLDPTLDPSYGRSEPAPLRQVLVIAANPRTGSTLLSWGLGATGVAGRPREYLHGENTFLPSRLRWQVPVPNPRGAVGMLKRRIQRRPDWFTCHRWTTPSIRRMIELLATSQTTPNGVFGIKVHAFQHAHWQQRIGLDLTDWGGVPVHFVHIERDDVVAQAVSHTIAMQTGQWSSASGGPAGEPEYSADAVARSLLHVLDGRAHWTRWFAEQGIEPLRFSYEQVAADYERSMRAVLAMLGEDPAEIPPPQVQRQAGARNREWAERFTAERPDLVLAAREAGP